MSISSLLKWKLSCTQTSQVHVMADATIILKIFKKVTQQIAFDVNKSLLEYCYISSIFFTHWHNMSIKF